MITQLVTERTSRSHLIVLISVWCGAALTITQAQEQTPARHGTQYRVSNLDSLGGTSSGGNSINNRSWVAGYSRLTGDQSRHAALWRNRQHHSLLDLGTLGGPNSSVTCGQPARVRCQIIKISIGHDGESIGEHHFLNQT